MVDNAARVENFFKESKRTPFSELPTVLLVGTVAFEKGTNIKMKNIFENIPVYNIPGYVRGTNKKVKIPFPGVPFTILSVKYNRAIRGIVKNMDDIKKKNNTQKGKFPNQIALDLAIQDKVVNVFLFKDCMKITGAKKPGHLIQTVIFVKSILLSMKNDGIEVYDKSITVTSIKVAMENVVFHLGYKIRKSVLKSIVNQHEEIESPEDDDAVKILYPTGEQNAKGGEKYYNFRVIHTGKVVFSGPERKRMGPMYDKFMDFIESNENLIRFS